MSEAPKPKTTTFTYGNKVSPFRFSEVDIIIPFHGQYSKVRSVLESILLFTKSNPYLVTLVDDASPNAAFGTGLVKQAPVKLIRTSEQKGFGGALRAGFEATKKPWVVFLHSDCMVADHYWLQRLGETALALKDKNVRLVHARTDNPGIDHPLLVSTKCDDDCEDKIVETLDPLPLICALTHRQLFSRIGGFIKEYPIGGYEDAELFYRMRKHGMKQAVCGKSWVHHDGRATISEIVSRNPKAKAIIESNYDRCMKDIS